MRHLKTYKLFENKESIEDMQQTIMDIFDDLRDEGFECYCNVGYGAYPSIEIRIYKDDYLEKEYNELTPEFIERHHPYSFEFREIEEVMRRIYGILMDNSNDIDLYFIENEETEHRYSLSRYGFEILRKMFPIYYSKFDRGFIIDFDIK